jgi:hypothetical protein
MHSNARAYHSTRSRRLRRRPPPAPITAHLSRRVFLPRTTQQVQSGFLATEVARASLALMNVAVWAGLLWVL